MAEVDRLLVRGMVEDFWRSFLSVARNDQATARATIERFERQIAATAELMPAGQANAFLRVVDEERELLFREYERDPGALKTRLGLGVQRVPSYSGGRRSQSVGDVVVNTAVRATVWEAVRAIFRFFR